MINFGGRKLHFIQIGLGTNSTIIQNLAGRHDEYNNITGWILEPCSEKRLEHIRGIAVEPVKELVDALRHTAGRLPQVQLLQVAMGEHEVSGAEVYSLSTEMHGALLKQVHPSKCAQLTTDLEYIRNMSCLGREHPLLPKCREDIEFTYGINLEMLSTQEVQVWTWAKLAKTLNFTGCEVVIIDAEGYDTKILQSLLRYCREHQGAWPELIQFETMGHCDRLEFLGAEKEVLDDFKQEGYQVVGISDHNSHLVLSSALYKGARLQKWVDSWHCWLCQRRWELPYIGARDGMIYCRECFNHAVDAGTVRALQMDVQAGGF